MIEQRAVQSQPDSHVNGWDALFASVDELVRRRPSLLANDTDIQNKPRLLGQIEHGLCAVPLYRVSSEPQLPAMLETILSGPDDSAAPSTNQVGPVIQLYAVEKHYTVRRGHLHVAQAHAKGQLFLQAQVTECLVDRAGTQRQITELLHALERDEFFRSYSVPPLHPVGDLRTLTLGSFAALSTHIGQIQTLRQRPSTEPCAMLFWYDTFYTPLLHLTHRCNLMRVFPECSELDLYLWAAQHTGTSATTPTLGEWPQQIRHRIEALWQATQR